MARKLSEKMLNALWHDISEPPKFGRKLLVLDMHEHCHSVTPTEKLWGMLIIAPGVNRKWAYQDALVPHVVKETE